MEEHLNFAPMQVVKAHIQKNTATPMRVFPLLCPERETEWLDGWEYEMIHSVSGKIEQSCVFKTRHHHDQGETVWTVSHYDPKNYRVEFIRITPGMLLVKIRIELKANDDGMTDTFISYTYTSLTEKGNAYIRNELDDDFEESMDWWERSINHFLQTGEKLKRQVA